MFVQTTVRSVKQRPDFSVSGQWDVVTINRDGEEEKHVFDGVLVCSGHYTHPVLPLSDFPGQTSLFKYVKHILSFKSDRI